MIKGNMNISNCIDNCCGCGACGLACPKQAITMKKNQHGFVYPIVDDKKCIDCGICINKCPVHDEIENESIAAFYGWNNDEVVRMKSSSGGIFSALADYVLALNGVVYGAVFDPKTKTVEYKSTREVELDDIRRSKYTECYTNSVFSEIKRLLEGGIIVLFCGTPCHVAGLLTYLGKPFDKLITCDFVCGGAASPKFFREHLMKMEKKYRSHISSINFRDKKMGWKRMLFSVTFENRKVKSILSYFDSYFNGFIEGIIKRENCFSCKFSANHYSDITIADYWGYLNAGVSYDRRGISMIIANSKQGCNMIEKIRENVTLNNMDLDGTRYTIQPRIFNQEKFNRRNVFFQLAEKVGYECAANETYMKSPLKDLILSYIKR